MFRPSLGETEEARPTLAIARLSNVTTSMNLMTLATSATLV